MATATLSARLPDPGQLTGLLAKLGEGVAGVKVPVFPVAEIQALVEDFRLELPDPASLAISVPGDAARLLLELDPAALARPLTGPLEAVRELASIDWAAELDALRARLTEAGAAAAGSASLFAPGSPLLAALEGSAIVRAIVGIARLLGAPDADRLTTDLGALGAHLQAVIQGRVANPLLAAVSISGAATLVARLERQVRSVARAADPALAEQALAALEVAFGVGADGLMARLSGVDFDDDAAVAALRLDLDAAAVALAACADALARTYGFTEAGLALLDLPPLRPRCALIGEAARGVDLDGLRELASWLEAKLRGLLPRIPADPGLDVASLRASIAAALGDARAAVEGLPPARIQEAFDDVAGRIRAPLERIEELKQQVEGTVTGALRQVEGAISSVDLSGARRELEELLGSLEASIGGLETRLPALREQIDGALGAASTALAGAREFILDPESGLKPQIERLFGDLLDLFGQLDIAGTIGEVEATVQQIGQELGRIQIGPVIDAAVDAIEAVSSVLDEVAPLLVTEDLKQKLRDATAFLRQVDFDEIGAALTATMAEIRAAVRADALDCVQQEYEKVVATIGQLDPTPVLQGIQSEVFDPLIAELEKLDPTGTLRPLQDGFREGLGAVRRLDPGEALAPARDLFADVNARLDEFDPARLLAPIEEQLAALRTAARETLRLPDLLAAIDGIAAETRPLLELLDPQRFLAPLDDGMAALRELIGQFDPASVVTAIGGVLRGMLGPVGFDVNGAGVAGLFAALGGGAPGLADRLEAAAATLREVQARLTTLGLAARVEALRTRHAQLKVTFGARAAGRPDAEPLVRSLAELDPVAALTPALSGSLRVDASFAATADALTGFARECAPDLDAVQHAIDALGGLRSPATLLADVALTPVRQLLPDLTAAGPRELLLALVDAMDPRQWRPQIDALLGALRDQLRLLTGAAVLDPLRTTLEQIDSLIDELSIEALSAALGGTHAAVKGVVAQFDPTPLILTLDGAHQRVIGLLEALDPGGLIAEVDRIYREDVLDVVRAISPEALLLEPLRELFRQVADVLGVLDVERIFAPVLEPLDELEAQLVEGLGRAGAAYDDLLAAIPA